LKLEQARLAEEHARYVPLVVKLAPDFGCNEVRQTCEMMLHHGVDGIIATNTTLSRDGVQGLPQTSEAGGLSGAPLRERALDMLMKLNKYVEGRVPLIASGGMMDAADAQARMDAGASHVQVYTGLIYRGPRLVKDTVHGMQLRSAREMVVC
jgi:dihydroorotate dehydrogenase